MRVGNGLMAVVAIISASIGVTRVVADDRGRFDEVMETYDPLAIDDFLHNSGADLTSAQTTVAKGTIASMRSQNALAVAILVQSLEEDPPPNLRRRVLSLLGSVYLRTDRYAEAANALEEAASLAGVEPTLNQEDKIDLEQTRDMARALKGIPPQAQSNLTSGTAPIDRDWVGLMRVDAIINGAKQDVVLDTGASYSTFTESTARRLKLRILEAPIAVRSATMDRLPARLAVADEIEIAGNKFRNVVALVVDDDSLRFVWGLYTIDAIVGFPILSRLGKVEFARIDGDEVLRVGLPVATSGQPTLYLRGTRPVAMLDFRGAGRVSMHLDTGAGRSSLSAAFARAFPALLAGADEREKTVRSAGGSKVVQVRTLPNVEFSANGVVRSLTSISVTDEERKEHGRVGQDVLGADGGFTLDFINMQITFLPVK